MARTWNLTLTPADGTREVVRGVSDDDMVRTLTALVHGSDISVAPARLAQVDERNTQIETREPIAA